MKDLTDPQTQFLVDIDCSLDGEVWCYGPRMRVANRLHDKGLVSITKGRMVRLTKAGKELVEEFWREERV